MYVCHPCIVIMPHANIYIIYNTILKIINSNIFYGPTFQQAHQNNSIRTLDLVRMPLSPSSARLRPALIESKSEVMTARRYRAGLSLHWMLDCP